MKNLYEILGIKKNAERKDIKKAYKDKSKKYHPDKEGGDTEKMSEINHAYNILSNETKRLRYDATGEEKEEAPFHTRFILFVNSVFLSIVDKTDNVNTTNLINLFKGYIANILQNLENDMTASEFAIKKYEIVKKRLKVKDETVFSLILDEKINFLKHSIENAKSEIAFIEECQKVISEYDYDVDKAVQQSDAFLFVNPFSFGIDINKP